ncbi:hypothetical protein [Parvibaculum sp.]|nr:hypothetical protein [Parvibaculum sp.]
MSRKKDFKSECAVVTPIDFIEQQGIDELAPLPFKEGVFYLLNGCPG